jgi:predicted DNA-binding ribbon-helix-helix protein
MKNNLKSPIVKRGVVLADHKTSVSLEEPFWLALKEIAALRGLKVNELVRELDKGRDGTNLSSTARVYVLHYFRDQTA